MMNNNILVGKVVHKRINPIKHKLHYNVFALEVDSNNLEDIDKNSRFLSYNKFNLFSFFDTDHGNGKSIKDFLSEIIANTKTNNPISRFSIISYPRVLGYVFNPITIYLGFDESNKIELIIYEVNNTFGQRVIYVLPNNNKEEIIYQRCDKKLFISPFNGDNGVYTFHVKDNEQSFQIGINLKVDDEPIINAYFCGQKFKLNHKNLMKTFRSNLLLTFKVITAIHYEALKLYFKGMKFKKKPKAEKIQICYINAQDIS